MKRLQLWYSLQIFTSKNVVIKNSIDGEPNNNIVEITGVHHTSVQDMSDDDSIIMVEPPKDTKCKRNPILTPVSW